MKNYINLDQLITLVRNAARNDLSFMANYHYRDGMLAALHLAQTLPVAISAEEWIPVEQALPEQETLVLVTLADHTITSTYFGDDFEVCGDQEVIAWQAAPEPYGEV